MDNASKGNGRQIGDSTPPLPFLSLPHMIGRGLK